MAWKRSDDGGLDFEITKTPIEDEFNNMCFSGYTSNYIPIVFDCAPLPPPNTKFKNKFDRIKNRNRF